MKKDSSYDARFSEILGGGEYEDLLIALDYYNAFQAETGKALKGYIQEYCRNLKTVKVLEAGPGTGIKTLELLKADPRVMVVAVDNEIKMLEVVKSRFATISELKDRVEFVYADILKFLESSEDNSYDVFASVYTLHNFTPDFRRKVINLIAKKIKPGGIFINGDKYAQGGEAHKKDFNAEIKNYSKFIVVAKEMEKQGNIKRANHLRQIEKEWIHHAGEDEKNKITVDEQDQIFKELGFSNVKWGKRYDLVTTVTAVRKI